MDFNNSDIILNAAKDYAEKGYRVFPLPCGGKAARLKKWQDKATTDAKQLEAWFGDGKQHNIAVVCDGLAVIDIDVKDGKNGAEGFELLTKKLGSLPDCPEAVTSTGGRHLFLRRPSGARFNNLEGLTVDGVKYDIDVKTESPEGKLGYVVACPSVGENGKQYILKSDLPFRDELPELPPKWVDFLNELKKPTPAPATVSNPPTGYRRIDRAEKIRRCENYVNTKEVLTEGDGGKKLLSVCNAIYWDFDFDRDDPDARAILNGYLSRVRHNDGSPYPWSEGEVRHKIEEVFKKPPKEYPRGWRLNNPEYCNNTNDICYKSASDLVDRLAAENAKTVEGGDGQPTEEEHFPVEYYPPLIRDFCKNVADWMSVDVSVPGILVLTAASAAIGYSATLEQKDFDGAIRPIFHSAIVLDSGLGKSPIMKRMFAPHNKKNDEEHKQSRKKEIQITIENMGKKDKDKKKIPFVPPRIIKGTTIEGMQEVLSRIHNEALLSELGFTVNGETVKKFKKPGILWFYEEMAEMLESMNAFKNGKGDSSVICTILDGSGASTTRVDKEKNRYYPDCHVALAGGIQGDMLQDIADKNPHFFYQGLFQRMNFVVPPFRDQKADSPSLNPSLKENYDSTIGNLFDIGERVYSLSSEAEAVYLEYKKSYVEILNPLGRLGDSKTKAERAIMSATSKSKRTILIIALILEILKDETQEDIISGETMGGAVAIVKFLLNNFRRIANYCPKEGATKKNQVYNAIIKAGDPGLSRREIQQRFFRGQGQGGKKLDDFLADLVAVYPEIKKNGSGNYINCP